MWVINQKKKSCCKYTHTHAEKERKTPSIPPTRSEPLLRPPGQEVLCFSFFLLTLMSHRRSLPREPAKDFKRGGLSANASSLLGTSSLTLFLIQAVLCLFAFPWFVTQISHPWVPPRGRSIPPAPFRSQGNWVQVLFTPVLISPSTCWATVRKSLIWPQFPHLQKRIHWHVLIPVSLLDSMEI